MAWTEIGTIWHSLRCAVAIECVDRYIFATDAWIRQERIRTRFHHWIHTWTESIATGEFAQRIHRQLCTVQCIDAHRNLSICEYFVRNFILYIIYSHENPFDLHSFTRIRYYRQLYWEDVIVPSNWSGPILVRSGSYLKNIEHLITKYSTRVAHNAIILLFTLGILPENTPNAVVCTKATMWAMPEVASALYVTQYSDGTIQNVIDRVSMRATSTCFLLKLTFLSSFTLSFHHI